MGAEKVLPRLLKEDKYKRLVEHILKRDMLLQRLNWLRLMGLLPRLAMLLNSRHYLFCGLVSMVVTISQLVRSRAKLAI